VRADSPHRTIPDLRGKPVVMGTQASGVTALGRTVLESLSIAVNPIYLEKAADGPPMLMDGRAEALWGAGVGWPAFSALAKQGGRFIVPDGNEIKTILAKNPALQPNTLPAKSYPGQDAPLHSVGSWSYVLANKDLKEEAAYLLARAVHRAEAPLAARGYVQHAELRHVPGHDSRQRAHVAGRGRSADFRAFADQTDAEGRTVLEARLRHLHVAALEDAQRQPPAREEHCVEREKGKVFYQEFSSIGNSLPARDRDAAPARASRP